LSGLDKGVHLRALVEELNSPEAEQILTTLYFIRSSLSLHGYTKQIQGEIVEFFEKIAPGSTPSVPAFYRVLSDQLSRQLCNELLHLDWEDLRSKKGISRSNLQSLIESALQPNANEKYNFAIDKLQHEGIDMHLMFELKAHARSIELELHHGTNRVLQEASEACAELIPKKFRDTTTTSVSLIEFLEEQATSIVASYPEFSSLNQVKLYLLIIRSIHV